MKSSLRWLYITLAVSIAATIFSAAFYFNHFAEGRLSDKTQDWGAFGEYLNLTVSFVNTAIVGYITYLLYVLQAKRDSYEAELLEAEHKPIVIFAVDFTEGRWYAYNVGKGAALNLVIARDGQNDTWVQPKKCYSLAPNEKFRIGWFHAPHRIIGTYYDIFPNNIYTSICQGDETNFNFYDKRKLAPNHWLFILRQQAVRLGL